MLQKNDCCVIKIDDIGVNGEGIGRVDGFTFFVEGGLPGELLEIRIVKLKKSYGYGKLINILKPSPDRIDPACPTFPQCGGCALQHLTYPAQLRYKQKKVAACLKRLGGFDLKVMDTIGMEQPFFYRNKAQFPMGYANDVAVAGFYASRSHRIIPLESCMIQHPLNKPIMAAVERFLNDHSILLYNEQLHTGVVRHVMTRIGHATDEVMVCLVINGSTLPHSKEFVTALQGIPGIVSILLNTNTDKTNVILGTETRVLWGRPYIMDTIEPIKFAISPLSFFQVNAVQTKILYELVVQAALADNENQVALDAYCGIGTISLFLAKQAKKVYGIESNPNAIADAKQNAILNNILNVEFIHGKAEQIIVGLHRDHQVHVDAVVVDPPRKGCDALLLDTLLLMAPKRIVYVSCDPATLARDLRILCGNGRYQVGLVQPIDCFCWTAHVETVVLLSRSDA